MIPSRTVTVYTESHAYRGIFPERTLFRHALADPVAMQQGVLPVNRRGPPAEPHEIAARSAGARAPDHGAFPTGDSMLARAMHAHDWDDSPLGAPHGWPAALRATVCLMLECRFPMCIAWGDELALLYNDDYAGILGDRHPAALGQPIREAWQDIWQHIEPLISDALAGRSTFAEDVLLPRRADRHDRSWFTFSYSPLRDESGVPVGICCVCTDTTAGVRSARRQKFRIELEERLRRLSSAEDIMRAVAELLGQHLRADRAGFAELHSAESALLFHPDWTNGKVASLAGRRFPLRAFRPALVEGVLAGRTVRTMDATDDEFVTRRDGTAEYAGIGARSGITVPLLRDGALAAVMYVHGAAPRQWRDDEEALVREVAERVWDALQRSRAETALRESEARFRHMADHAPVMVWTTDSDGHCTYLNRAWFDFTGQTESEGLGFGWLDALHPEDKSAAKGQFISANQAHSAFRAEYRLRRRDGAYRWVIDAAAPRIGHDGAYLGYVGSLLDVDELKTAETEQANSNARFRAAIDAIQGVLWTNDASGRMNGEQPGWAALTGQDFDQYKGSGWLQAVHPDDAEPTIRAWQQAVEERRMFVFEHRLRRSDGQWRHYSIRAVPTFGPDGALREWVGVHTDVTELRRNEEALRAFNTRLELGIEESTRERDRLWRMSHDIMAVATFKGYFISVNPAFTAALGWSEQEATSIPIAELTHPEHRDELTGKMAALAEGKPLPRYEVRDLHRDGSYRWLSWTVVPEGEFLYGVARDVTVEKRQTEALQHAEEALRQAQKMEAVGQLTGGLAHDFNNLLASMVSNLEIMKMRLGMGGAADLGRYIDGALAVADRAAALTHRLLAFSRRQTLDPKLVNVNRLVSSMTEMIQRTVGPSVQVRTDLDELIWNTRCDPNQLESALLNLAINARDAMADGGRLTIATGNMVLDEAYAAEFPDVAPGEYVTLSVTDSGSGMTPEVMARAFDPFFTTKPLGQGTGLGLSMIYGFTKQSGGHIRIYSEPGRGTTIRMKLPRHFGDAEPDDRDAAQQPSQAAARATILIVDDESALRALLAEMMELLGYAILQAPGADEALRLLGSTRHIDLLVTDVGLPGRMNGRQLADAARLIRPDLKVLFITGYTENAAMRNGMLEPGMQVLTKPFVMDSFAAKIRAMLESGWTGEQEHA